MQLITNKVDLTLAIQGISSDGKKLDAAMHVTSVSCLQHYFKTGDATLCAKMVEKMPKASRKNKLIDFFVKDGGLRHMKNGQFKKNKTLSAEERKAVIDNAQKEPFWSRKGVVNEDAPYVMEDERKALVRILTRRMEKAAEHGQTFDMDAIVAEAREAVSVEIPEPKQEQEEVAPAVAAA